MKREYRSIADIINGMSGGDIWLGFGHETEYWGKAGKLELNLKKNIMNIFKIKFINCRFI